MNWPMVHVAMSALMGCRKCALKEGVSFMLTSSSFMVILTCTSCLVAEPVFSQTVRSSGVEYWCLYPKHLSFLYYFIRKSKTIRCMVWETSVWELLGSLLLKQSHNFNCHRFNEEFVSLSEMQWLSDKKLTKIKSETWNIYFLIFWERHYTWTILIYSKLILYRINKTVTVNKNIVQTITLLEGEFGLVLRCLLRLWVRFGDGLDWVTYKEVVGMAENQETQPFAVNGTVLQHSTASHCPFATHLPTITCAQISHEISHTYLHSVCEDAWVMIYYLNAEVYFGAYMLSAHQHIIFNYICKHEWWTIHPIKELHGTYFLLLQFLNIFRLNKKITDMRKIDDSYSGVWLSKSSYKHMYTWLNGNAIHDPPDIERIVVTLKSRKSHLSDSGQASGWGAGLCLSWSQMHHLAPQSLGFASTFQGLWWWPGGSAAPSPHTSHIRLSEHLGPSLSQSSPEWCNKH